MAPVLVGLNVAVIVQVALAANVAGNGPQVLVWLNRPWFMPPTMMPLIVSGALAPLVNVTVCGALVTFKGELNVSEVGDTV
jgi:hypothetical protein